MSQSQTEDGPMAETTTDEDDETDFGQNVSRHMAPITPIRQGVRTESLREVIELAKQPQHRPLFALGFVLYELVRLTLTLAFGLAGTYLIYSVIPLFGELIGVRTAWLFTSGTTTPIIVIVTAVVLWLENATSPYERGLISHLSAYIDIQLLVLVYWLKPGDSGAQDRIQALQRSLTEKTDMKEQARTIESVAIEETNMVITSLTQYRMVARGKIRGLCRIVRRRRRIWNALRDVTAGLRQTYREQREDRG